MKRENTNLNIRDLNKLITENGFCKTILKPDELDLIIAYRILNNTGRRAMMQTALDFARTPTMRKACIRGVEIMPISSNPSRNC